MSETLKSLLVTKIVFTSVIRIFRHEAHELRIRYEVISRTPIN
jgi:hypothetical protein